MITDFQYNSIVDNIITFSDIVAIPKEKQPEDIQETVIILGSPGGSSLNITGTVDQEE